MCERVFFVKAVSTNRISYIYLFKVCIHSNATVNFHFSADDLVSCCHTCGFGCKGGFPGAAWSYWTHKGIVSGGSYGTKEVSHSAINIL